MAELVDEGVGEIFLMQPVVGVGVGDIHGEDPAPWVALVMVDGGQGLFGAIGEDIETGDVA